MDYTIKYGVINNYVDITRLALAQCVSGTHMYIPAGDDNRVTLFGDHCYGKLKHIVVSSTTHNKIYTANEVVSLDIKSNFSKLWLTSYTPTNIVVQYGTTNKYTDVTNIALKRCVIKHILYIPASEEVRTIFFNDPAFGTLKHIRLTINGVVRLYNSKESAVIDVSNINIAEYPEPTPTIHLADKLKLDALHNKLTFVGGNIRDEYPEQIMSFLFVNSDSVVLELGSNVGRNTCTIASKLKDQTKLVTLECDPVIYKQLLTNRNLNEFKFHTENAALSYRPLQLKGRGEAAYTIPCESKHTSDSVEVKTISGEAKHISDSIAVKTITFQQLEAKYKLTFNTLVLDCEGAFYFILMDYPDMLNNITTVIVENDYLDKSHKEFVDTVMLRYGLTRIYYRFIEFGPYRGNYYEVWTKG